jgi:predicted SAM-dependent methyltransferase
LGFSKLKGVDKYIPNSFIIFNKIEVLKKDLNEINDKFDIITMHHSFEHMQSQLEVLKNAYKLLYPNGILILRIPIKNEAWNIYKENWVQIDAPRHYYIHTKESIKLLAKDVGFIVENTEFDSTSFQFWGSEQYKLNIPLRGDKRSYAEVKSEDLFSSKQINEWETKSTELNNCGKGDQAIIILRKIND